MPTRIWIDRAFLESTPAPICLLCPWYNEKAHQHNKATFSDPAKYPYNSIWTRWIEEAPKSYRVTHSIEEAEVAVIPQYLNKLETDDDRQLLERTLQTARTRNLRIIAFWQGDKELLSGYDGITVYAQATSRSKRAPNIETLPAWAADMLEKYRDGQLPSLVKGPRPTVSFCGNSFGAATNATAKISRFIRAAARTAIKGRPFTKPHIRARAIESCLASKDLETRFSLKNIGWRGFTFQGRPQPTDLEKDQEVFADNLFSSIYALCVRGEGNFSYRLYEVLSAGRIPVIVDSDTLMPLHHELPWRDISVWVSHPENTAHEIVKHFESHSANDLQQIQESVLKTWREKIRPEVWFPRVLSGQLK